MTNSELRDKCREEAERMMDAARGFYARERVAERLFDWWQEAYRRAMVDICSMRVTSPAGKDRP